MNRAASSSSSKRIVVLFGGRSVEHEISVISGMQVVSSIDSTRYEVIPVYIAQSGKWYTGAELLQRSFYSTISSGGLDNLTEVTLLPRPSTDGPSLMVVQKSGTLFSKLFSKVDTIPFDVAFPAFHGQYGEDGCIQGLFEMAGVPYVGAPVTPSAVAMNKLLCKMLAKAIDVPVLPCGVVNSSELAGGGLESVRRKVLDTPGLQFPLFVKPCNLGSSIGVSRAKDVTELDAALALAFRYDSQVLVEPCITELMEINVSVGEWDGGTPSCVEIPVSESGVLSYEEKYMRGGKGAKGKASGSGQSQGMASLTRVIDPKDLDAEIKNAVQGSARRLFLALGSAGVGRFDFIFDKATGKLYFNELNPIPGSFAFYLWEKSSPPRLFTEILTRMIEGAETRFASRQSLQLDVGFKALK